MRATMPAGSVAVFDLRIMHRGLVSSIHNDNMDFSLHKSESFNIHDCYHHYALFQSGKPSSQKSRPDLYVVRTLSKHVFLM